MKIPRLFAAKNRERLEAMEAAYNRVVEDYDGEVTEENVRSIQRKAMIATLFVLERMAKKQG